MGRMMDVGPSPRLCSRFTDSSIARPGRGLEHAPAGQAASRWPGPRPVRPAYDGPSFDGSIDGRVGTAPGGGPPIASVVEGGRASGERPLGPPGRVPGSPAPLDIRRTTGRREALAKIGRAT